MGGIREKYHSKSSKSSNYAHYGIQTKLDLPADFNAFTNFSSCTQSSYTIPLISKEGLESASRGANQGDVDAGRLSHIVFGEQNKPSSYATVQKTSYLPYFDKQYKHIHLATKTQSKLVLGDKNPSDLLSMYQTTAGASFIPIQVFANSDVGKIKGNGDKSSIILGEAIEERRCTRSSVTECDYKYRPSFEPSMICKPVAGGIVKSLVPSSATSYESQTSKDFNNIGITAETVIAAGTSTGALKGREDSVICGDERYVEFETTNSASYQAYKPSFAPKREVNGTESKISFGEISNEETADNYISTAQMAYIKFSDESIRSMRQPIMPAYSCTIDKNAISLVKQSTMAQHYAPPASANDPVKLVKLESVGRNRLFPVFDTPDYSTTHSAGYLKRTGIYGNAIKRSNVEHKSGSSIVLGDQRFQYYSTRKY